MTGQNLRYNISDRLDRAGRRKALSVRGGIIRKYKIANSTWHYWLNVTASAKKDIPASVLRDISEMLGVHMEDLFTEKTAVQ